MSPSSDHNAAIALRPRARIIKILGEELISSEMVAVVELVKNAYDADATRVVVRFTGPLVPGHGRIEVIDNGHGMTLETVRTAFMELGTNSKRKRRGKRCSEEFGRRMLGEKGIGRFASARLATELELITRRKGASNEVFAIFDWTQFDDDELFLDQVEILTETRVPHELSPNGIARTLWHSRERPTTRDMSRGTVLRMSGLKRAWSQEDLEELQRGLSRLISPFAKIPDFEIRLELPDEYAEFSEHIRPPRLIKYPHYSVKGRVAADGRFELGYRVHALEDTRRIVRGHFRFTLGESAEIVAIEKGDLPADTRKPECGPVDVELRVWDRDDLGNIPQKLGTTITNVRRDLNAIAGINIHRDGFRVLPYGEPNNDWLRLDIRRVQKPQVRFSNNNIAGYVSITADRNPHLRDQSNREGLDNNQAYEDLQQILLAIIANLETNRQRLRPKSTGTRSTTPRSGIFEALNLDELREHLSRVHPDDKVAEEVMEKTQTQFASRLEEIQDILARYHSLATLGQLVDIVLHDGRHPVAKIKAEATLGIGEVKVGANGGPLNFNKLNGRFVAIDGQADVLQTVFLRIEPFGGRKRGRPSQLYVEDLLRSIFSVFESKITKLGIAVSLPRSETLVRVDESEFQQIVANLLDNSLYWLQHVPEGKRRIQVTVRRESSGAVELVFADSGPGVPDELQERIFEPYFSAKPEGVGLGLAIAGEIVKDYYKGDVELMEASPLGGATFRIVLRKRV